MTIFINLIFIMSLASHYIRGKNSTRFNAVSNSIYGRELYHRLKTEDAPDMTDPMIRERHNRERICASITRDGFFKLLRLFPIRHQEIRRRRTEFRQMYNRSFNNRNVYRLVTFNDGWRQWREHVIVCALKSAPNNRLSNYYLSRENITPMYVTKEYNVGIPGQAYKPGRFVIGSRQQSPVNHRIMRVEVFEDIFLAEKAAKIYQHPNFNEDLYYHQIKKYAEPVVDENIDPICRMVSKNLADDQNQYQRLCAAASKSLGLNHEFACVDPNALLDCQMRQVFFRMEDGHIESERVSFIERTVRCPIQHVDGFYRRTIQVFVSRAYKSNEVFVFCRYHDDDRIFLENLSTNMNIVDELNSFDFIEN